MPCKRAVRLNLRRNARGISLFRRDPSNPGCWLLSATEEEATGPDVNWDESSDSDEDKKAQVKRSVSTRSSARNSPLDSPEASQGNGEEAEQEEPGEPVKKRQRRFKKPKKPIKRNPKVCICDVCIVHQLI